MALPRFGAAIVTALALGTAASLAQEDDIFSFIPPGGRSLLETAQASGLPDGFAARLSSEKGDTEFWRGEIDSAGGLSLQSWELDTLAQYLAVRAPIDPAADLPRDGRDLAMQLCQSCHIITVVITQSRAREAWLGTMQSPSHIEIKMTPEERGLLADYLVLNAGIPIDEVPQALRAGGASY
ncbi:hypothetical protein [Marimonas lutisalis]|uniref:hypothetical protein n=1 Tax=Marimonas lutisalis TaxID=2545756 RepID=UPI0010FA2A8D|nr:hypothetical protein [Marimonas lutisalis]